MVAELRRRGRRVNHKCVGRIMRQRGVVGLTRRRRRSLTKPDTVAAPVPDLIGRDFTAPAPGQRLVGDITYLPIQQGWLYLATVIDLHTREVIGHAMAEHMRAELVRDALDLALRRGLISDDAIFHTDRGSQYTSQRFRSALSGHGVRSSVGRTGSCFDNAVAESFFATLKTEIGTTVWATRDAARNDVFAYLGYYNHDRLHSTLNYRTPHEVRVGYRQSLALVA
ncbi:IS3 family transposase [Amycolatopsis sp. NPDC051903]|uniref:IS3 family transposase n=1 Tax=Amycolatopsis sp. NPDC051903 TaxID=3363936 RepID=UPI00378F8231